MSCIISNDFKITVLMSGILRVEKALNGKFFGGNTFFVPSRPAEEQCVRSAQGFNYRGYDIIIPDTLKKLSDIKIERNGKTVYRCRNIVNDGELPPPCKTPQVFAVSDNPRIIVPPSGYSAANGDCQSGYTIDENVTDVYLLLCGGDAKLLRKQYVALTGRCELVRLSSLGLWDSRYFAYSEETAKKRIMDYSERGVPIDNMVLDTDWRSCEKGWGYDVNTDLFPDLKRFFSFAHSRNVDVMFNDHPEPVTGAHNLLSPCEVKYRVENLTSFLRKGLDSWWYDRNWMTKLISPVSSLKCETWGMYVYYDITQNHYLEKDGKMHTRPVIMSNINNVSNGAYNAKGTRIFDSASHRYSIQWTGDTYSTYDWLKREIENMILCGNNAIVYFSSDIGGHNGNPTADEYLRWVQYGVFSPVYRPHCANFVERTREPWAYDERTFQTSKNYINLRYRLLPLLYKNAYESFLTGLPIFKSLSYCYPKDKKAGKLFNEYMLDNYLLVRPVIPDDGYREIPVKNYKSEVAAVFYNGTEFGGEPVCKYKYSKLDFRFFEDKPHKSLSETNFSAVFKTQLHFDKETVLALETTGCVTICIDGEKIYEDDRHHLIKKCKLRKLDAYRLYNVEVRYFQNKAIATLKFCTFENLTQKQRENTSIYLPDGEWIDLFDGKSYSGGKTINKHYPIDKMPLFVKGGAVVPLAYEAPNTTEQKWNKVIFDCFPSDNGSVSGYLYEDDTKTVAYQYGKYKVSPYTAMYKDGVYTVEFLPSRGAFDGNKNYNKRYVTLRVRLNGNNFNTVTVDGTEISFEKIKKDRSAFPLNSGKAVPDGDVLLTSFEYSLESGCSIKIF